MKSDFEKKFANEAVAAAERRWQAGHERQQTIARHKARMRWMMILGLLAAAGVAAWMIFRDDFSDAGSWRFGSGMSTAEKSRCDEYSKLLNDFMRADVAKLTKLPKNLYPKHAPAGTCFHILSLSPKEVCNIYEVDCLNGGEGIVKTLSPILPATEIKPSDLKSACSASAYLIEVNGQVYIGGKGAAKDVANFMSRVRNCLRGPRGLPTNEGL